MARPKRTFSAGEEKGILAMAECGISNEQIAAAFETSTDTLSRHLGPKIKAAKIKALAKVAKVAFQMAQQGNPTMLCFVLKTQGGWRETAGLEIEDTRKPQVYEFTVDPKPKHGKD